MVLTLRPDSMEDHIHAADDPDPQLQDLALEEQSGMADHQGAGGAPGSLIVPDASASCQLGPQATRAPNRLARPWTPGSDVGGGQPG